jgi:polysaccharide biosynthesis protein PslJ
LSENAQQLHPTDLDPSRVSAGTYLSRLPRGRFDAAFLLCIMLALLMLVPAPLILPGLTDVGRPALVVGIGLWAWWFLSRLNPFLAPAGPQPIRWAVLAYLVMMLTGYAVGLLRGLTTTEANSADRWMLYLISFCGVIMVTADGIRNWSRLVLVLRVLVICAAAVAVIGLIEYVTQSEIARYLTLPGLQQKGWIPNLEARGSEFRVASTTGHYIEFSVVMATVTPFALHFAVYSVKKSARAFYALCGVLIVAAIPATVSRTGIIALGIAFIVLFVVWNNRMRYNMLFVTAGLAAMSIMAKPSLVRDMLGLFLNAGQDTSIQARTGRYTLVFDYVAQRPWLGRGTGTWVSPMYTVLDNQWLDTLLSNGILGVVVMTGLHVTGIVLAIKALRRATRPADRHICAGLVASQLIALAVAATFDSLSFSTNATVVALLLGACGAVWRLTHPSRALRTSTTRAQQAGPHFALSENTGALPLVGPSGSLTAIGGSR